MTAWIIRAGKYGEREQFALNKGVAGAGFHEISDMSKATSKDDLRAMVAAAYPNDPPGRRANFTGQLWALRNTVRSGDLIVMPLKSSPKIAMGICVSGYNYRANEPDPDSRHTIGVDWKTTEVSRAAIKDDLLNTINGAMTIFQASKNNAESRLAALLKNGIDPGNVTGFGPSTPKAGSSAAASATEEDDSGDVLDPVAAPTLEAIQDRVRRHLIENFKGHRLTELIADILRVHGYVCEVSPPGPDQGIDIIAGRGALGLDGPTLIVEVKSEEGPVGSKITRGLLGAMSNNNAEQGLLVAWGGINKPAKAELNNQWSRVRVWDSDEILRNLFDTYDRLPDKVRVGIPLKRAWVLDEETG